MKYERNAVGSGFQHQFSLTSVINPKIMLAENASAPLCSNRNEVTSHQILIHNTTYTKTNPAYNTILESWGSLSVFSFIILPSFLHKNSHWLQSENMS